MAIRMYPKCTPDEMERLAGVRAGTHARLKAFEAKKPHEGPALNAWYESLFADDEMHALSSFESFGWGRLTTDARNYTLRHFPQCNYAGETSDPVHAQALIHAMGVSAEGITSVCWG